MFGYSASFDSAALDIASERLRVMPRLLQTALKRRETPLKKLALAVVQVEPKPRTDDLIWTSDLQRKAFFASDGFGNGIPYPPTGDLLAGWRAAFDFTPDGGGFAVWNVVPYADYVVGEHQQPMHAGRWVNAPNALDEFAPVVIHDIEETFLTVGDPFAGVRR